MNTVRMQLHAQKNLSEAMCYRLQRPARSGYLAQMHISVILIPLALAFVVPQTAMQPRSFVCSLKRWLQ